MVTSVAATLLIGVVVWFLTAPGSGQSLLAAGTALGALVSVGLAWRRWIVPAAIMLTLATALIPLVGFASEAATNTPITELLWLALAFGVGAVLLPNPWNVPTLASLWLVATCLLLTNEAIPTAGAMQAVVMLGLVCAVQSVISLLGNRLEGHTIANQKQLKKVQGLLTEQNVALDAALAREQSISRLKEEFLASFSHELRTPMNAVLGLCEALLEDAYGPLSEMQRKSLETIQGSGQHLLGLIVDILDLSRIGAGKLPTLIQPVDANQIGETVIYSAKSRADEKGVQMVSRFLSEPVQMRTDARKVQRILSSLMSNAVKFTEPGKDVGLDMVVDSSENVVLFTVWDSGEGLDIETLSSLISPLERSGMGLTQKQDGLGLGLAVSTRLTHLLGGRLVVESPPGKGCRFTLVLPIAGPRQITVFGDLNCPFSHTLNEWFEQANAGHLIHWQGVEHMPELQPHSAQTEVEQARLRDELERLGNRASESLVAVRCPAYRPNSGLGLRVLRRIETLNPELLDEARARLFRAIWSDGKDIGDPDIVREVMEGIDLGDLSEMTEETEEVAMHTAEWRNLKEDVIPLALSPRTGSVYAGLGHQQLLRAFLKDELGLAGRLSEGEHSQVLRSDWTEGELPR